MTYRRFSNTYAFAESLLTKPKAFTQFFNSIFHKLSSFHNIVPLKYHALTKK
nr:MAG TPA: hypothetical protein [Caudoviricetes sp.]